MARVIVCVCSGGVLSFIGFIFGLGFLAIYLIAVANISTPIENAIPPKKRPFLSCKLQWRNFFSYNNRG